MIRYVSQAVLVLLLAMTAGASTAHGLRAPVDTTGIAIPSLSHSQMAVISQHRAEIETLASWVAVKNEDVRKLLAFSRRQYVRCFWGLVPRSIEDEASPLNECSHAYFAADREILVRMRNLPM
jgi:hypothetical protein